MGANSKIEWTDATWSPVTGCTPVSPGCANCYAARMAKRLQAMGNPRYRNGFEVTCHYDLLGQPLHWRKPRRVFVCSMADLFHVDVPDDFIAAVFGVMAACSQHTFQVLTKRPERMRQRRRHRPGGQDARVGRPSVGADARFCIEHGIPVFDELAEVAAFVRKP